MNSVRHTRHPRTGYNVMPAFKIPLRIQTIMKLNTPSLPACSRNIISYPVHSTFSSQTHHTPAAYLTVYLGLPLKSAIPTERYSYGMTLTRTDKTLLFFSWFSLSTYPTCTPFKTHAGRNRPPDQIGTSLVQVWHPSNNLPLILRVLFKQLQNLRLCPSLRWCLFLSSPIIDVPIRLI